MTTPPRIVIVGAGISGLSLAYRLQERMAHADITLLEEAGRTGGTAWTLRENGYQVEMGPNGFRDTKPTTLTLCRDLGLGSQLIAADESASKNRYVFLGDRLRLVPASLGGFLGTDLLSWRGKLSVLWERFRSRRTENGDESIDAFARRRAGNEAADVLADAVITGVFAGDPKLLSLPACFPDFAALEREYGSLTKAMTATAKKRRAEAKAKGQPDERPGKIWSFAGGLSVLVERLTERLQKQPEIGVKVRFLRWEGNPKKPVWSVGGEGKEVWQADALVLMCPAYEQARLLAGLNAELGESISAIPYNRIAVVAFGYRQSDVPGPIDGFGFIAPQSLRRDLLGVQWCSSIFPQRAPLDCVLLRAMCGGWHRPEMVDWDDAKLLAALRDELRLAMHITAEPIFHKIVRWHRAIPQYHLGHLERVAQIEKQLAKHPGLFLGGNAYRGVSVNDCTEQAGFLAERVGQYLGIVPAAV